MRKALSSLLSACLAVCLLAPDAGAGTVKVRPDEMVPFEDATPLPPWGVQGPMQAWAIVRLPAGKTIKKVALYSVDGQSCKVTLVLYRQKIGAFPESMAAVQSQMENAPEIETSTTTAITTPTTSATYTYFLYLIVDGANATYLGAALTYQ